MRQNVTSRMLIWGATLVAASLSFAETAPQRGFAQAFDESFAAPETPTQQEVSNLLKEVGTAAFQAGVHAARLEAFARAGSRHTWQSHAWELNAARDKINAKGKAIERLKELRGEALAWQQRAIDRIQAPLAELAANTTTAIEYLNKHQQRFWAPEYKEAVGNMYIYADEVRDMIAVKLDYAEARARLNELEAGLAGR